MRSRWAASLLIAAVVLLLGGCSSSNKQPVFNPTPIISGLFPDSTTATQVGPPACATGPILNINISGTGFITSSQAQWNGSNRTTSFNVNTNQLTVSILACDIATPGIAQITVVNPEPNGGTSTSNSVTFTITAPQNPVPSISSLSPSSAVAGSGAFTLTVNGSNFISTSQVAWNGSPRTTSFSSDTLVTAAITAADVATVGTAQVTVVNPSPGGGTSTPDTFTITSGPVTKEQFPQVISVNAFGGPANGPSSAPAISADGRFVAFYSQAKNLAAHGASGNIFVRDTCMGAADCTPQTIAADLAPDGSTPNGPAAYPVALSADGRYVAFASEAANLTRSNSNRAGGDTAQIFVRDLCLGSGAPAGCVPHTDAVSIGTGGDLANNSSKSPSMSADGRFIAFITSATNLVAGANFPQPRVFVRDTCAGPTATTACLPTTILVSADALGELRNAAVDDPAISADGRYVAFVARASNLGSSTQQSAFTSQILLRDTCLGLETPPSCVPSTIAVSVAPDGSSLGGVNDVPSISADGRLVVFQSKASSSNPRGPSAPQQVLLRDTCLGRTAPDGCVPSTTLISADMTATAWAGTDVDSFSPRISSSGRYVSFVAGTFGRSNEVSHGILFVRDTCFGATAACAPQSFAIAAPGADPHSAPLSVDKSTPAPITPSCLFAAFYSVSADPSLPSSGLGDVFLTATPVQSH